MRGSNRHDRLRQSLLACGILLAVVATSWAEAATNTRTSKPEAKVATRSTQASTTRKVAQTRTRRSSVAQDEPARPSVGQQIGLHAAEDPLDLKSSVALVIDQDTQQVLFSKNPQAVLPIASITKLMTALVVTEAGLPLDEVLTISQEHRPPFSFFVSPSPRTIRISAMVPPPTKKVLSVRCFACSLAR